QRHHERGAQHMKRVLLATCGFAGLLHAGAAQAAMPAASLRLHTGPAISAVSGRAKIPVLRQQPADNAVPEPERKRPVSDVVLQGCLVADDAAQSGDRTDSSAASRTSAPAAGDVFLLRHATRGDVGSKVSTEEGEAP